MPVIAVSSLSKIAETAVRMKSREMITLLSEGQQFHRPAVIDAKRHLVLGVNDIADEQDGLVAPQEMHVHKVINFAREWDQTSPLLVHCWFGVSRSPAAALIAALSVKPELDDGDLADMLRAASPQASPNLRLVAIGDRLLERQGRLIRAVNRISRGVEFEGEQPFSFTF